MVLGIALVTFAGIIVSFLFFSFLLSPAEIIVLGNEEVREFEFCFYFIFDVLLYVDSTFPMFFVFLASFAFLCFVFKFIGLYPEEVAIHCIGLRPQLFCTPEKS